MVDRFIYCNTFVQRGCGFICHKNFVTPNALNNCKFTKSLGKVLSRPTIFTLPAFAACIELGEMSNELLLSSNRVYPSKLMESGYKFLHPELNQALINLK